MKPLKTSQRVLVWFCGHPPNESARKWEKIVYIIFTLNVIICHFLSVVAGATFINRNVSVNLEETLFSLFHTVAFINTLYQSVVIVILCRELAAIFGGLSTIYKESK